MILAIITARADSKGLPGKNLMHLGGKPLIQHSFDVAIESNVFDKIILSTNSESAIELAKSTKGIEVPFRRTNNLCKDNSSQVDVINHALDSLIKEGIDIKHFVLLQPTAPFRTAQELRIGVKMMIEQEKESVIGVTEAMHHPADYLVLDAKNRIQYFMPEYTSKPRQNFPKVYFNNGAFYGCTLHFFKEKQVFYNENSSFLMMSENSLIDIDTKFDMKLAEGLINNKN